MVGFNNVMESDSLRNQVEIRIPPFDDICKNQKGTMQCKSG
jgi:hypothetical protein